MLPSDGKTCKGCKNDFCHRQKIVPFDLVFSHKERYYFPLHGDWKNKQASNKESTRYFHADPKCIMPRFPYFSNHYIQIPSEVRNSLQIEIAQSLFGESILAINQVANFYVPLFCEHCRIQ